MKKNVLVGKSIRECFKICFSFEFCVLALGTSWITNTNDNCWKLKFIMYGGNWTLTHSHLYLYWHFPTMVGYCHGGNVPASHENYDDDNFLMNKLNWKSIDDDYILMIVVDDTKCHHFSLSRVIDHTRYRSSWAWSYKIPEPKLRSLDIL